MARRQTPAWGFREASRDRRRGLDPPRLPSRTGTGRVRAARCAPSSPTSFVRGLRHGPPTLHGQNTKKTASGAIRRRSDDHNDSEDDFNKGRPAERTLIRSGSFLPTTRETHDHPGATPSLSVQGAEHSRVFFTAATAGTQGATSRRAQPAAGSNRHRCMQLSFMATGQRTRRLKFRHPWSTLLL